MKLNKKRLLLKKDFLEPYSYLTEKDANYLLKVSIFRQSSRIVYRSILSFWDVEKICQHTEVKPESEQQELINISNIKNRYLEVRHANEIIDYIRNNVNDFILPNITSVINKPFTVTDIESNKTYRTEIFEKLTQSNGYLEAYIQIPKGDKFTISDGNHRTYAIHQLVKNKLITPNIEGLNIGIDFYLETSPQTEKKLFVTLNSGKSIDSSVMSFLNQDDLISSATKSLLGMGENHKYAIHTLQKENSNYIGIDLLNSKVSKSNNTISFNILKNMISILTFNQLNADKKFELIYKNNQDNYHDLMNKISKFLNYIFTHCEPFSQINYDRSNIKSLREEYISMTGAGLYVIAKLGHIGIIHDQINIESLAQMICDLTWKRITNNKINPLFEGGIVTPDGKISNNRNSLNNTSDTIKRYLNITEEEIIKLITDSY
ncbi:DNA sulfur modification protein DndB [Turicibacter sanguinis]|uniref:DNA sulfur modification protein DndB n=1 Tax=Turicibacter sanguinis TaxID=154288 RepID=UPI0018AA5916|nr:DNA sulfur modification protein DndB [Turicibacter sanguinis]MDB8552018.1 DNA sulfur modification protein DndB [Turicibacter sanguinis]